MEYPSFMSADTAQQGQSGDCLTVSYSVRGLRLIQGLGLAAFILCSACRGKGEQKTRHIDLDSPPPAPSAQANLLDEEADKTPEPAEETVVNAEESVGDSAAGSLLAMGKPETIWGSSGGRFILPLSRPVRFSTGYLAPRSPGGLSRFFVDIGGVDLFTTPKDIPGEGPVQSIRFGKHESGVRIVFDLKKEVSRRVFYLPEPFRLVVDLGGSDEETRKDGERRKIRRVVLDPGHGGKDPGAIGPGGIKEKDIVLDIAHRAAPLLARELGISTMLTRDGDGFVELPERVARANGFGADLFISIHCNAGENHSGSGMMTFILDVSRDRLASAVAARENDASLEASAKFAEAFQMMKDGNLSSESLHFAELLQRSATASMLSKYSMLRDGGVHQAGFFVLAGAQMPAVLFETAFISSPSEEKLLNRADVRQKFADAVVNAVRAYQSGY